MRLLLSVILGLGCTLAAAQSPPSPPPPGAADLAKQLSNPVEPIHPVIQTTIGRKEPEDSSPAQNAPVPAVVPHSSNLLA